ncbi:TPA: hypothetical protein BOS_12960 [Bos taurus]|nr:TPA: hypothetical protein BOS_12960 [Bos taurus]
MAAAAASGAAPGGFRPRGLRGRRGGRRPLPGIPGSAPQRGPAGLAHRRLVPPSVTWPRPPHLTV